MKNSNVEIVVNGRPVRQYYHEGNWYVEARDGAKYEVKVKNNTFARTLAVVSVDGLCVISGKPANDNSGGYVLAPYEAYNIKGFRVSNEKVNLFVFAAKEESYAAKAPEGEKSTENCGVISVRLYSEKPKPKPTVIYRERIIERERPWPRPHPMFPSPYWKDGDYQVTCNSLAPDIQTKGSSRAGGCSASMGQVRSLSLLSMDAEPERGFDMGTKFSKIEVKDEVGTTQFEKEALKEEINIYYASFEALKQMGVPVEKEKPKVALPKGFKQTGFCVAPE